jgi:hypothetical protein
MNHQQRLKQYEELETIFSRLLSADLNLINEQAIYETSEFVAHGEYGLAYDILAYQFNSKIYLPSNDGLSYLIRIAQLIGVTFPALSI